MHMAAQLYYQSLNLYHIQLCQCISLTEKYTEKQLHDKDRILPFLGNNTNKHVATSFYLTGLITMMDLRVCCTNLKQ